jgi:hypothetical protein
MIGSPDPPTDVPPEGGSASATELGSSTPQAPSPCCTRLMDGIRKPNVYREDTIQYANLASSGEPYNTQEALSHPQWKASMSDEFSALMKNNTWTLVPPQSGRNVIDCR